MHKLFILLALCAFAVTVPAQTAPAGFDISNYGVRIEPDKRVMIVLATLEAARSTNADGEDVPVINTPLSAEGGRFRELLKSDLAAMPADLRQKISAFVTAHKRRYPNQSDAQMVAPFISMAYALTPAPELADPVVTTDLPGNLLDVLDFAPLVREFYRRSSFSGNINEYIKTYQKTADGRLRASARDMVSEILGYLNTRPQTLIVERVTTETQKSNSKKTTLKNVTTRERERSFTIVPEMLAPVGTVNFVNVKDDYYVIVPAELPTDRDLGSSEIRRGFLQFVVDPLVYGVSTDLETIRPVVKKLLDERRKADASISPDVYLTVSRSLVAAIDARQVEHARAKAFTAAARLKIDKAKTDAEKRAFVQELEKLKAGLADETALRLSEDYEKGALLDFYFADQLKGFEDSGFDIASSMKEMIASFDGTKEADRLAQAADARKRAQTARESRRNNAGTASIVLEDPVINRLVDIQKLIAAKNYDQAAAELQQLREKSPADARVAYNLGRVTSLVAGDLTDQDLERKKIMEAKNAYESVLKIALDRKSTYDKARSVVPADPVAVRKAQQELVDPALLSLTYVALAKIYEFFDNRDYALKLYDMAIGLNDVAGGAREEAISAKARLVKQQ